MDIRTRITITKVTGESGLGTPFKVNLSKNISGITAEDLKFAMGDADVYVKEMTQLAASAETSAKEAEGSATDAAQSAQDAADSLAAIGSSVNESAANALAAKNSADAAKTSEDAALGYKDAAAHSAEAANSAADMVYQKVEEAKEYASNAKLSETNAKASEESASKSATDAGAIAAAAKSSETNAKTSETNAKGSADAANASKVAASASQSAAKTSETNAKASEVAAKTSETNTMNALAKYIRIGTGGANKAFDYAAGGHGYFEWFEARTRTAYVGFPEAGKKHFEIRNEKSDGDIGFRANKVLVNNVPVVVEGQDGFHGDSSKVRINSEAEFLDAARDQKVASRIFRNDQEATLINGVVRYAPAFLFKAGDTWGNLSIDFNTGRLTTRGGNSSGRRTSPSRSYLFSDEVWTRDEADNRFLPLVYENTSGVPMRESFGDTRVNRGWVCIAEIGDSDPSKVQNSRYLFTVVSTSQGYNGRTSTAGYMQIGATILNASTPSKNFAVNAYNFGGECLVRVKQISLGKAEIWVSVGPYSRIVTSCVTSGPIVFKNNVMVADNDLPVGGTGEATTYDAQVHYRMADRDWSTDTFQPKGDYATNTELNNGLALKFDKAGGTITGALTLTGNVTSKGDVIQVVNAKNNQAIQLDVTNDGLVRINSRRKGKETLNHSFPSSSGTLMQVGDYGLGRTSQESIPTYDEMIGTGFYVANESGGSPIGSGLGQFLFNISDGVRRSFQLAARTSGERLVFRSTNNGVDGFFPWREVLHTGNTTKDSNGNLKAASPIVKVFADHIETNEESEGVEMEHLGVGHYLIKGVVGFNSDGAWGINNGFVIPQDHNGKNMVLIDYEVRPDGDIEVFVFHQQNADMPERFQNKRIKHLDGAGNPVYFENYEPCDVPESRWIDMRVEMPEDSIYNVTKREQEEAMKEQEAKEKRKEALDKIVREQQHWLNSTTKELDK